MRTLASTIAVSAAAAASLLLGAPAALAHDAPGDNGTVKIHDSATDEADMRNEPHVCTFYIDGFKHDGAQEVDWEIQEWAPTGQPKGTVVETGSLTLDGSGHERTTDINLPDGHYKLFWTFEGEHGKAKHKVFWVDCVDETESPSPSDTPSESPSDDDSVKPTASNAPGTKGGGDDLAETGATVGITSAAGLALVGAGAYLVMRRRNAGQH